ncbi:hypothetical protein pdam_00001717 [Pocillopora damicornis]|uniref:Uncharacterized protein n=1 Tax=Pocillopora damicornis TaxID=46731 RepID=A0A3M6UPX5_POCDA|nr:hypothetical protein pdam_00001717 [Pocillopora damicornis]
MWAIDQGITISATSKSAMAMLTNMKLVSDLTSVKEGPTSGNHKIAKASAKTVNRDGEKDSIATRPPTEKIPKNMDFIGIYSEHEQKA